MDADGYPTHAELLKITHNKWEEDPHSMIEYLREIGWDSGYGNIEIRETSDAIFYTLSTGGWSGNEDIIEWMQRSVWWLLFWFQTQRGGHYTFEVPK